MTKLIALSCILSLLISQASPFVTKAIAEFSGTIRGSLELSQEYIEGPVSIEGSINGLSTGYHGFHIHEVGAMAEQCAAGGLHYNPHNQPHGGPYSMHRHVGDLGNIMVLRNGGSYVRVKNFDISLNGPYSVVGRLIVLHEKTDDLGMGGDVESHWTGNSGARLACAVIGIKEEKSLPFDVQYEVLE